MICFQCNKDKPTSEYTKMASGRPRKRCKFCIATNARNTYAVNPTPRKNSAQRWRDKNPPAYQAHRKNEWRRRRARKLAAFVEHVDSSLVFEIFGGVCGICGFLVEEYDFHVDHIVPLSRGGKHSYDNSQLAHPFCNRRKHNKLMQELV